jgi:hypothetical protein
VSSGVDDIFEILKARSEYENPARLDSGPSPVIEKHMAKRIRYRNETTKRLFSNMTYEQSCFLLAELQALSDVETHYLMALQELWELKEGSPRKALKGRVGSELTDAIKRMLLEGVRPVMIIANLKEEFRSDEENIYYLIGAKSRTTKLSSLKTRVSQIRRTMREAGDID